MKTKTKKGVTLLVEALKNDGKHALTSETSCSEVRSGVDRESERIFFGCVCNRYV